MVENRFVGMKSRGVYEAPGMTILYAAHRLVEQLTMDRDLMHLRDRLAPEVAEMVYYGFWHHAKMDALMAFIRQAQQPVSGDVRLDLYRGNIAVAGRSSANNLYDEGIATMEGGGSYNQTDAEGFSAHSGFAQPRASPAAPAEVLIGLWQIADSDPPLPPGEGWGEGEPAKVPPFDSGPGATSRPRADRRYVAPGERGGPRAWSPDLCESPALAPTGDATRTARGMRCRDNSPDACFPAAAA